MTQKELIDKIKKNNKLMLVGEENYFTDFLLKELRLSLNKDFESFNFIEFEHKSETYSEAQMKISSTPLMDSNKIVHIKNFIFTEDNSVWKKSEYDDFCNLVKKLDKSTILIISNHTSKTVINTKQYKNFSKLFETFNFIKLKNQELCNFIDEYFTKELGKGIIKKDIISEIANNSGYLHNDSKLTLYDIVNLLKKILAYYSENTKLTKNDLNIIFEKKEDADIFSLIDAIVTSNKIRAFKEYYNLIEKGEARIKILTTIGKIFSNAIKVDFLLKAGYSKDTITKELGKSIYAINNAERLAIKLGRGKLINLLDAIVDMDFKMKTGDLSEEFYAEVLLIKLFEIIGD